MWSLSPFVLLLGACAKVLHAQGFSDAGMMMGSYPGMGSMGSYNGMSNVGNFDDPLLLNCFASFDDANGEVANEITVTIVPKGESIDSLGGMNLGYGHMGMGGQSQGPGLSAKIQLFTNVNRGKAFVVFTERARVNEGCKIENFGGVLLNKGRSHGNMGYGGGYGVGGGYGMGYGGGYGMGYGGYGMGYGGGYGGMGGYGGYGLGSGYGMGYGMGMGHSSGSMFGGDDGPKEGVVTELHVSPGALTTAVVDELDFDDLDDLAGRGVVVCSDITYDWDWQPICTEPIFSCCALKYDNVGLSLVGA